MKSRRYTSSVCVSIPVSCKNPSLYGHELHSSVVTQPLTGRFEVHWESHPVLLYSPRSCCIDVPYKIEFTDFFFFFHRFEWGTCPLKSWVLDSRPKAQGGRTTRRRCVNRDQQPRLRTEVHLRSTIVTKIRDVEKSKWKLSFMVQKRGSSRIEISAYNFSYLYFTILQPLNEVLLDDTHRYFT